VYSPVVFGKKTDPEGDYIRKYLPQLKKYPAKYIYTPWEAPLSIQKAAGCIIGRALNKSTVGPLRKKKKLYAVFFIFYL
jgi:cryptochrome